MEELRQLAEFIAKLQFSEIPETVKNTAKRCVLDTVGAAIGAVHMPLMQEVATAYYTLAGEGGNVCVWGMNEKKPLLTSIFLNGMLGHGLELDDVHTRSKTHIGTVVVPAAWGLAEQLGASGEEFLLAVICGYETMARIGMGFGVSSHRNKGWHVTATAGTFGAAAACAKLLRLDAEKTLYALGMAGTQSFGLWAFLGDGASCKVLHPARAATSGAEAALLAKAGMTGPAHILDAKDGGLFAATSDAYDYTAVSKDLGEKYEIEFMDNKPYPCCRSTHCTIDGALAIAKEYGITWEDIDHVEVDTYLVGYKQCGVSEGSINPQKPIDAKFSSPFTVAAAFVYGKVGLAQFTAESIQNPKMRALLSKVKIFPKDVYTDVYPNHWGCEVRVTCKDGRVLSKEVPDASGSVDNPLSTEQVQEKATALMGETSPNEARRIATAILSMEKAEKLPPL